MLWRCFLKLSRLIFSLFHCSGLRYEDYYTLHMRSIVQIFTKCVLELTFWSLIFLANAFYFCFVLFNTGSTYLFVYYFSWWFFAILMCVHLLYFEPSNPRVSIHISLCFSHQYGGTPSLYRFLVNILPKIAATMYFWNLITNFIYFLVSILSTKIVLIFCCSSFFHP